jgi:hypothetical protein
MPSVIDAYLDAGAYPSEKQQKRLRQMRGFFEKMKPVLEINRALAENRLGDAFAELAATYGAGDVPHRYLVKHGERLVYQYAKEGDTRRALAGLDLLARSNLEADLPRDMLRTWYADVAPDQGPERFEEVAASAATSWCQRIKTPNSPDNTRS